MSFRLKELFILQEWLREAGKVDLEGVIEEIEVIVAIAAGEDAVWKGTLEGLKKLLRNEIKAA